MLATRRIARHRAVVRTAAQNTEVLNEQIDKLLQSIATLQQDIDDASVEKAALEKQVEKLMRTGKQSEHEWGELIARIVEVYSKASKTVDPQKLYNKLSEKDFFSCVKVQLGELTKIMSEKEIEKIADNHPAEKTGDKFEIIRPKKKVSRK